MGSEQQLALNMMHTLESSFKWEIRTLVTIFLGILLLFFERSKGVGEKLLEYTILMIMVTDTFVSILFTRMFLSPIIQVLREGKGVTSQSAGHRRMRQTMYMTLFGSSLAVLSSTLLYVMLLLYYDGQVVFFQRTIWANPFVVFGNLDSICNDIGILFVCGALKKVKPKKVNMDLVRLTAMGLFTSNAVSPLGDDRTKVEECVFDSKAYEKESSGGAGNG